MYSEGIDRLTVYGSSNIESKLQAKLSDKAKYKVSFCEYEVPMMESKDLIKDYAIGQAMNYLDLRFGVLEFTNSNRSCTIKIVNTDYTIKIVCQS